MADTGIEWADKVWNPVTGCTKVSQGCKHCYAEVMAKRTFGRLYPHIPDNPLPDNVQRAMAEEFGEALGRQLSEAGGMRPRRFTDVQCHPDRLDAPLRWRKPARIFVNSMSDLFHDDVPDEFIAAAFGIMAASPHHTFLILTKRPERMRAWFAMVAGAAAPVPDGDGEVRWCIKHLDQHITRRFHIVFPVWPLPNVWLGVSVEDQATADQRIPLLLQTPAAVRWISAEPLLGPIDLDAIHTQSQDGLEHAWWSAVSGKRFSPWADGDVEAPRLDWVVVGGESGSNARDCDVAWVRSIVRQCQGAGTPVFVKQLGQSQIGHLGEVSGPIGFVDALVHVGAFRKSRKGSDPAEWPEDIRVREFPAVAL